MSCAAYSAAVTRAVSRIEGVEKADVNLLAQSMIVQFDKPCTSEEIISAVKRAGFGAELINEAEEQMKQAEQARIKNNRYMKRRLILSLIFTIPLFYLAMESSDAVLMSEVIQGVCGTIELSRAVVRNIKQNLFWAFGYNTLGIPVAAGLLYAFGGFLLNPMIAAAAMSLSSVSVVSNALRLTRWKRK